jgi:hypothetical protein
VLVRELIAFIQRVPCAHGLLMSGAKWYTKAASSRECQRARGNDETPHWTRGSAALFVIRYQLLTLPRSNFKTGARSVGLRCVRFARPSARTHKKHAGRGV